MRSQFQGPAAAKSTTSWANRRFQGGRITSTAFWSGKLNKSRLPDSGKPPLDGSVNVEAAKIVEQHSFRTKGTKVTTRSVHRIVRKCLAPPFPSQLNWYLHRSTRNLPTFLLYKEKHQFWFAGRISHYVGGLPLCKVQLPPHLPKFQKIDLKGLPVCDGGNGAHRTQALHLLKHARA